MRKILVFSVIFVYVFVDPVFVQFAKLPELIQHFVRHQKSDSKITFSDFIYMHYVLNSDGDASDDTEENKPPFKSGMEECGTSPVILNMADVFAWLSLTPTEANYAKYSEDYFPGSSARIWQPPRQKA